MASTIKIKRSGDNGTPVSLASGELAYSWLTQKLYIGWGSETQPGIADNIASIGGKYLTDLLDVTPGTLTASKPVIVDANKKINEFAIDNLYLNDNTIASTNTDGNILLDPAGAGYVQVVGTNGLVIPIGTTGQRGPTTTGTIRYNTDTTQFEGYSGTNWSSLGGVRSVDGLTFIVAELSPGLSDDTLYFYTATGAATNKIAMELDQTSLQLNNTTDASSVSTGSFFTAGGVGIAKKLYVGTDLHVLGNSFIGNATTDTITAIGKTTFTVPDNDGIALDIKEGANSYIRVTTTDANEQVIFGSVPDVRITSATAATSTSTGALTVTGGVGIGGALYVSGAISADSASFLSINNTPIGNITPSTGAFTIVDVDNIRIDANTISSTNLNGDINITPNGTGKVVLANPFVGADSLEEYIEDTVNGLLVAGEGIDLTYNDVANTLTIDAEIATTTNLGVASFATANFTVTSGAVSTKTITLGTSTLTNGSTTSTLAGLQQLDVDNIRIDANEISSTNTNGNISLNPNGTGVVAVNNSRVTGLLDPVDAQDAATKAYVDARAAGLDPKQSVRAATTGPITLSGTQTIDGVVLVAGDRVLVKDQANTSQNGVYVVAAGAWARSTDMDEPSELTAGLFFFVESGTLNSNAGFVKSSDSVGVVGTDPITFVQFSGAGQIIAGDAMSKTGNQLDVVVAATGGIEISADALQLKSSLAGNGLSYSAGVLTVGGTANRITTTATTVDIASTYVGQTSITTLGTIGTGTWQGTVVAPTYGGTGVNNGTRTITIGGNFAMSGAHAFTGTLTGATAVTFPTTGTLATLTNTETISNKIITNSSIGSVNPSTAAFTTLAASGLVTLTNTTDATALGTAAVVLSGGLSVAKQIRVGTNIVGNGTTSDISGFTIDGGTY